MSKIGKKPLEILPEVTVEIKDGKILVDGSKGSLSQDLPKEIAVKIADNKVWVFQKNPSEKAKMLQGTMRQLIANMVTGVKEGWSKNLEIIGTGYRVALSDGKLLLSLGFSHQVEVVPPPGISFDVSERKIAILGADKAQVGRVASRIRGIKPPDSYKGKGIRYEGEFVKLKSGKQVKVGLAGVAAGGAKGQTK